MITSTAKLLEEKPEVVKISESAGWVQLFWIASCYGLFE